MSELQNKIVHLIQLQRGQQALVDIEERRDDFLKHAIELYYGMGGDTKGLIAMAEADYTPQVQMDAAIGDVLYELAAVGHIWDIDIIQAAYNRIDTEVVKLTKDRHAPLRAELRKKGR